MNKKAIIYFGVAFLLLIIMSKDKLVEMLFKPTKLIAKSELLPLWRSKFNTEDAYNSSIVILNRIAKYLKCSITDLLQLLYFESKFSPSIQNSKTKATGLIQFIPSTAVKLRTSVDALKQMSILNQLPFVELYLTQSHFKTNYNLNIAQLYLLILRGYVVTPSNEKTMLIDYFGTYFNPGPGSKQARYLYSKNGTITLDSVYTSFNLMFP